eukprot:scpid60451/ scgid24834/ 
MFLRRQSFGTMTSCHRVSFHVCQRSSADLDQCFRTVLVEDQHSLIQLMLLLLELVTESRAQKAKVDHFLPFRNIILNSSILFVSVLSHSPCSSKLAPASITAAAGAGEGVGYTGMYIFSNSSVFSRQ